MGAGTDGYRKGESYRFGLGREPIGHPGVVVRIIMLSNEPQRVGSIEGTDACQIEFVTSGQLRARKVVRRSNLRVTGKYPSLKEGRMVQWESTNERDCQKLLDACSGISGFREQPAIITYRDGSTLKRHYPDLFVCSITGKEFWEIKSDSEAEDPDISHRTALLSGRIPRLGYGYRIVLSCQIRRAPFLANANYLLRFGRRELSPLDREHIRRIFVQHGSLSWSQVHAGALGSSGRDHVCRLILEGELAFDMSQPISSDSVLRCIDHTHRVEPWVYQLFAANRS